MSDVGLVAKAIAECAKVVGNWQVSRERRRMQSAIDAGERYILVNEKQGEYAKASKKRQQKLLLHFHRKFFSVNN